MEGNHNDPQKASAPQELFALENLAQPPKRDGKPKWNFARFIGKALEALRRFEPLPEAVRRLVDLLLEYGPGRERTYVYCKTQKLFRILKNERGQPLDKAAISRALAWAEGKKIVIHVGGYYTFHSGLFWRLNEEIDPGQAELELSLAQPDCQPFFPREINLNDAEVERAAAVEPDSTGVEPDSTGVKLENTDFRRNFPRVESGSTRPLKEDLKVQASNKLKAVKHASRQEIIALKRDEKLQVHDERSFLFVIKKIFGSEHHDIGKWRNRFRLDQERRQKAIRVINALIEDILADKPIQSRAAKAEDLWKRFA